MTLTRTQLLLTMVASLLLAGCTLVPCNHAFPTAAWYWSADAIQCRKEHAAEKLANEQYKHQQENHPLDFTITNLLIK